MRDQATILTTLNEAAFIIADHFEPGIPRDPMATVKRLIEMLNNPELEAAVTKLERGDGLSVVKYHE
jgi:hypothetical protein